MLFGNIVSTTLLPFYMKTIFVGIFLGVSTLLGAQNLKFKADYDDAGKTSLKFSTETLSGKVKGNHEALTVTLRNETDASVVFSSKSIKLVDITGKGDLLCGAADVELAPGEKVKLVLENCSSNAREGLFQLNHSYSSRKMFYEDASFLRNKRFDLIINGEVVSFLTDL